MVCKQVLLRTNGNITTKELNKYGEFFKCSRCLYEKTADEYNFRKSGQKLKECKECRSKATKYRLKKRSEQPNYENNVETNSETQNNQTENERTHVCDENSNIENRLESSEDENEMKNKNTIFRVSHDFFDNMNYLTDFYVCCDE